MERKEVIKVLFEELEKKVPNRDICRVATKEQIQRIMKEVDFEAIERYLESKSLGLTAADIPRELVFEMILYSLSTTEWDKDGSTIYYMDTTLWNLEDAATKIFIQGIKKVFGLDDFKELTCLKLDDFLKYAKSDEPSL